MTSLQISDSPHPNYGRRTFQRTSANFNLNEFQPFQPVFSKEWLFLEVILRSEVFKVEMINGNSSVLIKSRVLRTSSDESLARYWIFFIFSHFSNFQLKWLFWEVFLKSIVFNVEIFNGIASILIESRGLRTSDDISLARYCIFLNFQPFQPIFS